MPWFPEYVTAVELARRDARAVGQADPVAQYVRALQRGDTGELETAWPGEVVVADPRFGELRGHRELREFVRFSKSMLAEHHARIETTATTRMGNRAVVELLAHLKVEGREVGWPAAIVAESPDDRSVKFRSYFSLAPILGRRQVRSALLPPGGVHPTDVVGRYQDAFEVGDVEATVDTFEPDGYFREARGSQYLHRGAAELRSLFAWYFSAGGGIGVQPCSVTDDGVRCAMEFTCFRWGSHELPPQAGIVIHERGPQGSLAAVRCYDDIEAPLGSPLPILGLQREQDS